MKVTQADMLNNLLNTKADRLNQNKAKKSGSDVNTPDFRDIYEGLKTGTESLDANPVYTNPTLNMNAAVVGNLMNESEDIQGTVNELIANLLQRQGYTEEQIKAGDFDNVDVDEIAREEAAKLIGPGGMLSPENVSDRIVDFAIGVFGGDKSKIDIIRSAIDRGFGEAEKILGELADVSKVTYEMIQDKLDDWINERQSEDEGENKGEGNG